MGNLYTQIVRHNDHRISRLSTLKRLWNQFRSETNPREKQCILQEIHTHDTQYNPLSDHHSFTYYRKKYGAFAWKAWERDHEPTGRLKDN
jgi:hypothetical protein